jgi:adenosylcobinamide-GDP ribazoletransferase
MADVSPFQQLRQALRFLTRLPVPDEALEESHGVPRLDAIGAAFPVAGAIVGLIAALAMIASAGAGLPALAVALVGLGAVMLATGGLHEDGLADIADGFGGGRTRERMLEIMKDPRVGTFGVLALVLAVGLKAALLADLVVRLGVFSAAMAFLAAAILSRAALLWPLHVLPSARETGASASAGQPGRSTMMRAGIIASMLAGLVLVPGAGFVPLICAGLAAGLGAVLVAALSARHINGQTGDVAGATQQVAELLVLAALVGSMG